ncbi:MAG: PAS domain-containing sensor histidine kinase [Chloroflexi bacterium]|nr:PAS domain-containing sensor histidine kinase [Chloroflexota bacterium]
MSARPIQQNTRRLWFALLLASAVGCAGAIFYAGARLFEQAYYLIELPAEPLGMAVRRQGSDAFYALLAAAGFLLLLLILGFLLTRRPRAAQPTKLNGADVGQPGRDVARLKTILDGMQEGIIYTEANLIRYANRTIAQMIGYDGDSLNDADTQTRLAGLYRSLSSLIGQNGTSQGVFTIRRKDGSEFDARVSHTHLEDEAGGVITIIQDNSQEKNLQAQKLRFVSNASHELRTPVANLKTRLYLLRRQPEKLAEHLDVMEKVVGKLQSLIEEMFDFAEIERGTMLLERQEVALQDLILEVIAGYQAKAELRAITLSCDLPDEPLHVFVDRKRLAQVIANLVSNAMSHTRESGSVQVRLARDKKQAIIQVQDNGVGIAQNVLEQVFHPFSLAKHGEVGGTALGLSISKEIIELHDGEITVESEAGKGTLFIIRLPLSA